MSKNIVKYELGKLKQRLKTFTQHTGFTYEVDEAYFLSLTDQKGTAERLSKIKWSNAENWRANKGIKITAHGTVRGGKVSVPLTDKEAASLTRAIKLREKFMGEKLVANVQSRLSIKAIEKYYRKYASEDKAKQYKHDRDQRAIHNVAERFDKAFGFTNDARYELISLTIMEYITVSNFRSAYKRNSKGTWEETMELIDFNVFGSDDPDQIQLRSSSDESISAIIKLLGITDSMIREEAKKIYNPAKAKFILEQLGIDYEGENYNEEKAKQREERKKEAAIRKKWNKPKKKKGK